MDSFGEYQNAAAKAQVSLRNDRDRIQLPALGLQEEAGKIGSLLAAAFASGKFRPTLEQSKEVKDRLADVLWYVTLLCNETKVPLPDLAAHSITQLQARTKGLDPDQR